MSAWNGFYEPANRDEWERRFLERLISLVGPMTDAEMIAEAAYCEHDDITPEAAAEFEAQEWARNA